MHLRLLLSITSFFFGSLAFGQANEQTTNNASYENRSVGIGYGLDYAGAGIMTNMYFAKYFGLYTSIGHSGETIAFSMGGKLRIINEDLYNRIRPFAQYSYGFLGTIKTNYQDGYSNILGRSLGIGSDIRFLKSKLIVSINFIKPFYPEKYDIDDNHIYFSFGLKINLK